MIRRQLRSLPQIVTGRKCDLTAANIRANKSAIETACDVIDARLATFNLGAKA